MECSDVRERLSFYIDGELDQASLEQVEAHLVTCASCRQELAYLETLVQATTEVEEVLPPAHMKRGIMEAVGKAEQRSRSCGEISQLLSAFIDGELLPAQMRLVLTHLPACPECSAELVSLKSVVGEVAGMEAVEPPSDLRSRIAAAARETEPRKSAVLSPLGEWLRGARWAGAAVAAGLIVIVIIGGSYQPERDRASLPVAKHVDRTLETKAVAQVPTVRSAEGAALADSVASASREAAGATDVRRAAYRHEQTVLATNTSIAKSKNTRVAVRPAALKSKPKDVDEEPVFVDEANQPDLKETASMPDPDTQAQNGQEARPKLIKVAATPVLDKTDPDQWSKEIKTEAAMHRSENRSGGLRIISTKF